MKALKLSSAISTTYAVIGLANVDGKLKIESGAIKLNEKALLEILIRLGAKGKVDEITKVTFTKPEVIYFTGLGSAQKQYDTETLRRAAGSAAR